jgi:hypothetical protein
MAVEALPKVRVLAGAAAGRSVSGCEYKFDYLPVSTSPKRRVFIRKYSGAVSGIDQRISAVIGLADIHVLARKNACCLTKFNHPKSYAFI